MDRKSAALSRRRTAALDCYKTAAACIGPVTPDISIFGVTRGQFSMIDIMTYLLSQTGPAQISLWTWTVADYEVEAVTALMNNGGVTGARLTVDYSASQRNRVLLKGWQDRFGPDSVKVCKTHAKIGRVWNADYRLLVRGSMNLNMNPRNEQFDLTGGGPDFDLVEQLEDEMPVISLNPSHLEAAAASKLGDAFDLETLDMFKGLNPWKP